MIIFGEIIVRFFYKLSVISLMRLTKQERNFTFNYFYLYPIYGLTKSHFFILLLIQNQKD